MKTASIKIIARCKNGHKAVHHMPDLRWNFDYADDSCELCGSHGYIAYEWTCEICSAKNKVEISGW